MIKLIEGEFPQLPFFDVITLKANSLFNIYGAYPDIFLAWCQYSGDEPLSVIMLFGGEAAVSCGKNADTDEIKNFLKSLGISECYCTEGLLCADASSVLEKHTVMQFENETHESIQGNIQTGINKPFEKIYNILSSGADGDISLPAFEDWYVDFSHRVRHNAARYALSEASAAITTAEVECNALIGGVATLPSKRRSGGGKSVLLRLCRGLESEGKNVLVVSSDANIGFYKKCGFKAVGSYCRIKI